MRIGIGYDIHRLVKDRKLILGGVLISFEKGLLGHSDGDALLHAVADALLGAAGMGDIGRRFPDSDPKFKDADSGMLLAEVIKLVRGHGLEPVSIDSNIICEAPRLAAYHKQMVGNIARLCHMPIEHVNVKMRTNEGLDAIGKGEAIAAQAVVLVDIIRKETQTETEETEAQ